MIRKLKEKLLGVDAKLSTLEPMVLVGQDDNCLITETQQGCELQHFAGSSGHSYWPYAHGFGGYAIQHTIDDAQIAEDWEELLVLTQQDKKEYSKWLLSIQ